MAEPAIAVAGAGLIGRRHIELVTADPGCELAAIVDPAREVADLAASLEVPWHASLGELFTVGAPDAVILATPNHLHAPQGLECVDAGVPMLVEKPIAGSVEEATRLVDAAEAAGVPLLVGHHRRHSPFLGRAREIVESGRLGRVVAVAGSAVFYKPDDYFDEAPWRRRPGGGPILINLIHELDALRFVCGDIESVHAVASNRARDFPVEDTAATTLQFADGALGTFLLSDAAASTHSWEQTSGENKRYPRYADEDCYVVAGTQGSLEIPTMRLRWHSGPSSWWGPTEDTVVTVPEVDPLEAQLKHFVEVIRGVAEPLVSGRDATESLRVVQAVAESAATGRTVAVQVPA